MLTIITPVNLQEEKEKFFASDNYNPQLQYNWSAVVVERAFKNVPHGNELIQAIIQQDHKAIVAEAQLIYGIQIEQNILDTAIRITSNKPDPLPPQSIEELEKEFIKAVSFFNLDYKVVLTEQMGFNVRPDHINKKLLVSTHANLQFFSVEGQVKHEIAHTLRAVNGRHNKIIPSEAYIQTEEGLTSYLQDFHSAQGEGSLFQHAAEYRVTKTALEGSMRDIFNEFISIGFNPELSWQRGIRHKFGFVDTSKPGDIMKPAMYFANEQKIQKLSKEEILRLFVGKIRIDELNNYPEYKGIIPQEKIREYYSL